jgi:hypothetical protein
MLRKSKLVGGVHVGSIWKGSENVLADKRKERNSAHSSPWGRRRVKGYAAQAAHTSGLHGLFTNFELERLTEFQGPNDLGYGLSCTLCVARKERETENVQAVKDCNLISTVD